jgi:cytochrome P450
MSRAAAMAPAPFAGPLPQVPPAEREGGSLTFMARFVRNPLGALPAAVYREDIVERTMGGTRFAWIAEPAAVKTVLLDEHENFPKTNQIRILGPLLGRGLLTSEGAEWRWQRQASAPLFRQQDLLGMVDPMVAAAEDLVQRWRREAAAGSTACRPIDADMSKVTLDVISRTLLPSADGTVVPAIEADAGRFQQGSAWAVLYVLARLPDGLPRPGRRKAEVAARLLRDAVRALIEERRAEPAPPDDLMTRLMRARDPETGQAMTDERLVDNLLTFYLAGHETTAKALTWTLYLLARAPAWADAIAAEADEVSGGGAIGAAHVDRLLVTRRVLKEAMRLYPPAPQMSRTAREATRLAGRPIAAGTQVIVPIYALHRHEKRWQQPEVFDPDRFLPDKEAAISRYQYMPFGAGPRICIGAAFALVEATVILATLARAARFSVVSGAMPEPLARVTLVPKGGLSLRVEMRRGRTNPGPAEGESRWDRDVETGGRGRVRRPDGRAP